jgi:hypothetical protein
VTERAVVFGVAILLVALALLAMYGMHDQHYKNRRWQMLEARLNVVEKIVAGDHD